MNSETFDIFSIFALLGGLALFLYGMNVMSAGLEKVAGGRLEKSLKKMTSNVWVSLLLGAAITIAVQSSSALTVMLVGLVNSGIIEFSSTISVIMGSNIGTTLTAWILSLSGISSDSVLLNMLKPENFSPVVALIGVLLTMVSKKPKRRNLGEILVGFAVLMYGMVMMSNSMSPLANSEGFKQVLMAFRNPFLGVLVGTVFTAIIQSSAASIGILQALALTGNVSIGMAIPIVMGQNIGTCATALISSFGVSRKAKKVAVVHVVIKILGTVIFLIVYGICFLFFQSYLDNTAATPIIIAVIHTVFNMANTALLLPFSRLLVKLTDCLVPAKGDDKTDVLFDERLLAVPSIAVAKSKEAAVAMAHLANESVGCSLSLFRDFREENTLKIESMEKQLDNYEDKLGTYLVKLSKCELTDAQSSAIAMLLHVISDFERIGDHSENLMDVAQEMHDKSISFSHEAEEELGHLTAAVLDILKLTQKSFENSDTDLAAEVEPLEQVIDGLIAEIKRRHVARLQSGNCTIELGFILTDYLTNCERISDHCSNIAVALIETGLGAFDTHEYLNKVKTKNSGAYAEYFREYSEKYAL